MAEPTIIPAEGAAGSDPLAAMGLDPAKAAEVLTTYKRDLAALKEESKAWKAEQAEYAKLKTEREQAEQARLSDVEKAQQAAQRADARARELEGQLTAATRRATWNEKLPEYLGSVPENVRPAAKRHFEALYLTSQWTNEEELKAAMDAGFEELRQAYGGSGNTTPPEKPPVGGVAAVSAIRSSIDPETKTIFGNGLSSQQFLSRVQEEMRQNRRRR